MSPGQACYEALVQAGVLGVGRRFRIWEQLEATERSAWESVAESVLEARNAIADRVMLERGVSFGPAVTEGEDVVRCMNDLVEVCGVPVVTVEELYEQSHPLGWSAELPCVSGWYWFMPRISTRPDRGEVVEVFARKRDDVLSVSRGVDNVPVDRADGFWSGPLVAPGVVK